MAFPRTTPPTELTRHPGSGRSPTWPRDTAASVERPATRRTNTAPRVSPTPRPTGPIKVRDRGLRPSFEATRSSVLTPLDEVRALDATAFAELPLVTVIELEVPGHSGPVWLRSAPGRGPHAIAPTDPVIDGLAWRALALAVASDRATPREFRALIETLAHLPANEPDRDGVAAREILAWMDDLAPSVRESAMCRLRVGQVLERLGVRVFSVRIEGIEDHAANGPVIAHAG